MGAGISRSVKQRKIYSANDETRVGRDEYFNTTGHAMYAYKFDAIQGPDGCISRAQVDKINRQSFIRLISYQDLLLLKRLPRYTDRKVMKSVEDVREADSFTIYLQTPWKVGNLPGQTGILDALGEKYKLVVQALKYAVGKYAFRMQKVYVYMEWASLPPEISYDEVLDLTIGLSDWILTLPPIEAKVDKTVHAKRVENSEAVKSLRSMLAYDEKAQIEVYFAGYMSHIIGIQERLNRFSGLPFILLSCGYRPHIVFKKIYHDVTSDDSSYDMAIVPMLSRKAFEHWKSKCTLTKLLKELDIYSDVDLVIFEGKNNAISHYHGAGILTFRNGAIFNGFFSDGLKDGFGRYSFPQGGYIEGHFAHDELEGDGTWVYSNGVAYSGHFVNTMKEGNGRLLSDNGDEYVGQFHKDLRNGYGVQRYINGNRYDGMWVDDIPEGPGKYTWANGQMYDGQMHKGRPHGVGGTMTYTSYDVYKGGFQNGMKHGVGRMLFAAGGWTAEYSGQWNSDTMDGTGRIVFVNGDSYEGTFKRNQFQGSGVFKSSTGDVYTGQFEAGLQEGRGKMEFWNKCFYEGEWKGSKMHGIGKFTGADGHTYVGEWVDDKMEGHGKFTWANGDVYEGQFKANQMDGQGKITHKSGNVWTGSFKNDRKEGRGQALKTGNQGVHRGLWDHGERTPSIKYTPSPNVKSGHSHANIKTGSSQGNRGMKKTALPPITNHLNGTTPMSPTEDAKEQRASAKQ